MTIEPATVSIIIPAYNRASTLQLTLKSFVEQDYPANRFEIIVADNNSTDNTKHIIEETARKSRVLITYFLEKRQGVHYARNNAAKLSSSDILYFTDDDMVADKNLLKNLIRVFSLDSKIASAGGRVLPRWENEPPMWIRKHCTNGLLSLIDRNEDLIIAHYDPGVYSCHQAIPRELFFKSGGFNPENTAGVWIGDGETGLNLKFRSMGLKFAYVGDSVIYHMIPTNRMTQKYLNKRFRNQANADTYTSYRKLQYSKAQSIAQMFWCIAKMIYSIIRLLWNLILLNSYWHLSLGKVYYWHARMLYNCKLFLSKKWRQMVLEENSIKR